MAANRKKGVSLLAGLDNLVEKPAEENAVTEVKEEPKVKAVKDPEIINKPAPKRPPGRPRKFKKNEKTEVIGVRLLAEEVRFLEEYGGKYGGKTGYVTYLIKQEMEKINEKHI